MRARRGYATRVGGLLVDFTLGGAVMGSRIPARTGKLAVVVRIRERDAAKGLVISRLDVVTTGGKVAASSSKDGTALDWRTKIRVVPGRYYYLRVWTKFLSVAGPRDGLDARRRLGGARPSGVVFARHSTTIR